MSPTPTALDNLTLDDYMQGRDVKYGITATQFADALATLDALNKLQIECGIFLVITSGYRPPQITDTIPGAVHGDAHERCEGADLADTGKVISKWCLAHVEVLVKLGLWMESPLDAHDHVHLQTYPPKSGNRIFRA